MIGYLTYEATQTRLQDLHREAAAARRAREAKGSAPKRRGPLAALRVRRPQRRMRTVGATGDLT